MTSERVKKDSQRSESKRKYWHLASHQSGIIVEKNERRSKAFNNSFLTQGLIINELELRENTALNAIAGTKQE